MKDSKLEQFFLFFFYKDKERNQQDGDEEGLTR